MFWSLLRVIRARWKLCWWWGIRIRRVTLGANAGLINSVVIEVSLLFLLDVELILELKIRMVLFHMKLDFKWPIEHLIATLLLAFQSLWLRMTLSLMLYLSLHVWKLLSTIIDHLMPVLIFTFTDYNIACKCITSSLFILEFLVVKLLLFGIEI